MLNFYLLFNIFNKNTLIKEHKEDLYLLVLSIIFCLFIYFNNYQGLDLMISVVSSLANSGLTLMESNNNLSLYFLLITIIGGSLVSNSSGIKLTRLYILLKITSLEIIKLISPNSIINKTIFNSDKKISDDHVKISFLIFISFFLSLFILSSLLVVDNIGFEKSFKLSILTLTNTVNTEMFNMQNVNFSNLLTSSKISLILFMIIGKIELISIFLIFKKILFKD
jgi:trk system potassium uptake protein TrkH